MDFACGTGTLLIAAANYILQHEQTGQSEKVAQALLEQMLYGFDIYNRAIFQTATGLGMMAPSTAFSKMHLYSLTLGLDKNGKAKLGSLEMLQELGQLSLNPRPITGTRIDAEPAPIEVDKFHLAIMNPPYTRGDIRHKQLDRNTEKQLREREAQLYYNQPMNQSSNANGFFVLAEKYLTPNGRIAFVMPMAMATNPSAAKTRRWLAKRFFIQYIIISYDPKRIFHSGNTGIGEMLLVLKRKQNGRTTHTQVIKLTHNPSKASDAAACANKVLEEEVEKNQWGVSDIIPPEEMAKGNWNAVQFTDNELYRIAEKELWNSQLKNQIIIDPMGRPIRNAKKCHPNAIHATPALYDIKVTHCNKLEVAPDCYVHPPEHLPQLVKTLQKANYLHLAERIGLNNVKITACRTTVPSVGSGWATASVVALNDSAAAVEKAIVIILNSTPGKLGMLLVRGNKIPSYPYFSKDALERIPFPRLRDLKPAQIEGLVKAYDELCNEERLSLPEAHKCPVQLAIDEAVCQHLGFDKKLCLKARHLLAQEPMITGKRYQFHPPPQPPFL